MADSLNQRVKVAVITGSSRGLGAAAAQRLARDGFFVIVNYLRSKKDGEETLRALEEAGGRGALVQGDEGLIPSLPESTRRLQAMACPYQSMFWWPMREYSFQSRSCR